MLSLAKENLPGLVSNLTSSAINKIWQKNRWKKSCQSRNMIYFIYFKWRYEWFYQIIKWLQDSGVLIDGVTETVKHEIKQQEHAFLAALLAPLAASLV